jgi:hypothetical protein
MPYTTTKQGIELQFGTVRDFPDSFKDAADIRKESHWAFSLDEFTAS